MIDEQDLTQNRHIRVFLALLYQDQGDVSIDSAQLYAQALPLYQRSLAIYEKALGAEHPHTRIARENLAACQKELAQTSN